MKSRVELDKEPRTGQFVIERDCPQGFGKLQMLPLTVWVKLPAESRSSVHDGEIYRITPESVSEHKFRCKPGEWPGVCEHMGRLIE